MTSLINEYRSTEEAIKELQERLATLKDDPKLATELEFESKLRDLLATYSKSLRDIVAILDPQGASNKAGKVQTATKAPRAPRQTKRIKNPHTGEVIETKGGNHKTLKAWKAEHGAAAVDSWVE